MVQWPSTSRQLQPTYKIPRRFPKFPIYPQLCFPYSFLHHIPIFRCILLKLTSYYSTIPNSLCNNDHHNLNTVRRILPTQSNVRHATCIGDRGCLGGEGALAHPDRLRPHEHDSDSESSFGSNQVIKLIIPSLHCGTSCTTWRPARCSSSSTLRLNTQLETPSWMQ